MDRHHDELKWLYMELYGNDDMFLNYAARCTAFTRAGGKA